jgi:hypothetical protein
VSAPEIDRAKHGVDILEHVLEGVHTEETCRSSGSSVRERSMRPWPGTHVVSAVQVQVIVDQDRDDTE